MVALAYLTALVSQIPLYAFGAVRPDSPLLVEDRPDLANLGDHVQGALAVIVVVLTAALVIRRYRTSPSAVRRGFAPMATYGLAALSLVLLSARVVQPLLHLDAIVLFEIQAVVLVALVAVAALLGMLSGGFARIGEVLELGLLFHPQRDRSELAGILAAAVGDPSVELAFWLEPQGEFVDADGRPVRLPDGGSGRASSTITLDDHNVGAIIYDETQVTHPVDARPRAEATIGLRAPPVGSSTVAEGVRSSPSGRLGSRGAAQPPRPPRSCRPVDRTLDRGNQPPPAFKRHWSQRCERSRTPSFLGSDRGAVMTHRRRHRLLASVVALLAVVGFVEAPPASAAEPDVGNFTSLAYDHSSDGGYWTQVDGRGVVSLNGAATFGAGPKRNATIVANPVGTGYWLVERNGHVSSFGEARSLGSFPDKEIYVPGIHLYISGGIDTATVTPSGKGLYGVDSLGGVHTLGDARSLGDVKKDIGGSYPVGVVSRMNPQTGTVGYWIADSGGGVYSFGLPFHGSMGRNSFIINGMTGTVGGDGYCIMDYGGYLSAFGDAAASGCANVADYHQDFVGIALKPGGGYALIKENGAVTIASGSRSGSQQAPWWCLWSGVCRPQTTSSVPRVKES